jgi:uncharacterized spore protein YtfJ
MDAQTVIDMVTRRVKETANVNVVFGDPIESQGATLIPVACVTVSGGGGGGMGRPKGATDDSAEKDKGMGMGLHVTTAPVGFIEVRDGEARMVDIVDKNKLAVGGLIVGGLVVLTMAKLMAWKVKHASAKR